MNTIDKYIDYFTDSFHNNTRKKPGQKAIFGVTLGAIGGIFGILTYRYIKLNNIQQKLKNRLKKLELYNNNEEDNLFQKIINELEITKDLNFLNQCINKCIGKDISKKRYRKLLAKKKI